MREELLETGQRVVMTSWRIGVHVYPHVAQRAVYAKLVSGLRASRDEVPHEIPAASACRSRREPLGRERVEERFRPGAGPKATAETPGTF